MIDLDRFKQVNDALGNDAADAVLYLGKRSGRNTVRLADADQPPIGAGPGRRAPEPVQAYRSPPPRRRTIRHFPGA